MSKKTGSDSRITRFAWTELQRFYYEGDKENYNLSRLYQLVYHEMLRLIPAANREYHMRKSILKLNYRFEVGEEKEGETLWMLPNELSRATLMLPSDY